MGQSADSPSAQAPESLWQGKRNLTYGLLAAGVVLTTANLVVWAVIAANGAVYQGSINFYSQAGLLPIIALLMTWGACFNWKQWAIWACFWALTAGILSGVSASVSVEEQLANEARYEQVAENAIEVSQEQLKRAQEHEIHCKTLEGSIESLMDAANHPEVPNWRTAGKTPDEVRLEIAVKLSAFERECL